MYRGILAVLILSVAAIGCAKQPANPDWNRRVEALSILSDPTEEQGQTVTGFFSVDVAEVKEAVDLSTEVEFVLNGEVAERQRFNIAAQPAGSSAFGCNCPPQLVCWVVDGFPRGCGEPPLVCDPFAVALDPRDDLTMRLRPLGDGLPEQELADDARRVAFEGRSLLAVAGDSSGGSSLIQDLGRVR